tara:strand:- start:723 stop:917 length:195 start_codon:yes stop_codon:yes gene_type:complete
MDPLLASCLSVPFQTTIHLPPPFNPYLAIPIFPFTSALSLSKNKMKLAREKNTAKPKVTKMPPT